MLPSAPAPVAIHRTISSRNPTACQTPRSPASGDAAAAAIVETESGTAQAAASRTARDAAPSAMARR
jgi:hypothetical protein